MKAVAIWSGKPKTARPSELAELEESLREVRARLQQAYDNFNAADDSELVESYIYEIQALQARYSYLFRKRKALDPASPSPDRPVLPVA